MDQIRPLGEADEQLALRLTAATITRRTGMQLQEALLAGGPVNITFENPVVTLAGTAGCHGPGCVLTCA